MTDQDINSLANVVEEKTLSNVNESTSNLVIDEPPPEMCFDCKGTELLCGKSRCPIIVKAESMTRVSPTSDSNNIVGSTPPGVFVGRYGYPKVSIGPMTPNFHGDTEILDTPEQWYGKSIDEIVDYRHSLIRGSTNIDVKQASKGGRLVENLQELAMASQPVDLELKLTKKPQNRLSFSENSQPFGPSAPLETFSTNTVTVDQRIEKAYYDRDQKSSD